MYKFLKDLISKCSWSTGHPRYFHPGNVKLWLALTGDQDTLEWLHPILARVDALTLLAAGLCSRWGSLRPTCLCFIGIFACIVNWVGKN